MTGSAIFPSLTNYFNSPVPFIILGVTYAVMGVIWFLMLTFFASTFSKKLVNNPQASKWTNKLSSSAFILMGLKVALTKR